VGLGLAAPAIFAKQGGFSSGNKGQNGLNQSNFLCTTRYAIAVLCIVREAATAELIS